MALRHATHESQWLGGSDCGRGGGGGILNEFCRSSVMPTSTRLESPEPREFRISGATFSTTITVDVAAS